MSNRYSKLNHLLLFQQKSHYQHIENPRATIRIDPPSRKSHSLHYKTKTTNQKDRQRKIENKKMLFNLLQIYNGRGLLSRMEDSSKKVQQKKRSLVKSFKKIEQQNEIRKQNKDLFHNIQNAQPIIGTKQDWDRHFEQHQQMQKKLCNYSVRANMNATCFKTFYHEKRRKLISQQKGQSGQNKSCKDSEQLVEIQTKKKQRKRRKIKRQKQQIFQENS